MQFGAVLFNYFSTWEETLSTIKFIEAWSFIIDRVQQYIDFGAEEIIFSGVLSKLELFEQIKEEIISIFNW